MAPKHLSNFEYYVNHCIYTGFKSIANAFRIWRDLMSGNYAGYVLLEKDCPFEECRSWFWWSLGEDNTYSKEFLEYLYVLCEHVQRGEVEITELPFRD